MSARWFDGVHGVGRPIILPDRTKICTKGLQIASGFELRATSFVQLFARSSQLEAEIGFNFFNLTSAYCNLQSIMAESERPARIMALDVGSRRIGVAVSDPLGITAQGLDTIQRQNKRRDLEALRRLLAHYQIQEVVLGLPLRLSGAEGTQSEKMRLFADDLRRHLGVTVHLWDERWTSTEANRLLRETDLSIEKRAKAVDRMAATLILQSWLEAHR